MTTTTDRRQELWNRSTCCRPTSGSRWCSSAATACGCSTIRAASYLDFVSGIGVASLGHAHPALARAIGEQAATLAHTSNLYFHPLQGELAARLSALTGLERAFFCNSGTEANEACLKFARRYWHTRGETNAHEVRRVHALVPWPDDGLAVGDVGRALSRRRSSR